MLISYNRLEILQWLQIIQSTHVFAPMVKLASILPVALTTHGIWEKLWKRPSNSFPFVWGESWKQCVEYRVDDLPLKWDSSSMFLGSPSMPSTLVMPCSPHLKVIFSSQSFPLRRLSSPHLPMPFACNLWLRIFMATAQLLEQRGIEFEQASSAPPSWLVPVHRLLSHSAWYLLLSCGGWLIQLPHPV